MYEASKMEFQEHVTQLTDMMQELQKISEDPISDALHEEVLTTPEGKRFAEEVQRAFQIEQENVDKTIADFYYNMDEMVARGEVPADQVLDIKRIFDNAGNMTSEEAINEIRKYTSDVSEYNESFVFTPAEMKSTDSAVDLYSVSDRIANAIDSAKSAITNTVASVLKEKPEDHCYAQREFLKNCSDVKLTAENATDADFSVISYLSYASTFSKDKDYLKDCEAEGKTVGEYCAKLKEDPSLSEYEKEFFRLVSESERYKDLIVDHSDTVDVGEVSTQIIMLRSEDNHAFIGIQGTQSDLLDWVNNTFFAGDELTAEEKWINETIYSQLHKYDSFDIAGHSQGGREAVSAAAFLPEEHQNKLGKVYNHDGPGYSSRFLNKYGEKFRRIDGNLIHIYPKGSSVGHLLKLPGGKVFNVALNESVEETDRHHMGTTQYDKNGNVILTDGGRPDLLSSLIRAFTTYAADSLSADEAQLLLPIVMRLFSDPKDSTKNDFSGIGDNLDRISMNDGLVLLASGYVIIASQAKIFLGTKVCGYVAAILGVDLNEMDPDVKKAFDTVMKIIDVFLMIKFVLSGPWGLLFVAVHLYLNYTAIKQKKEREAYIAQNPRMHVQFEYFSNALTCLENANQSLHLADKAGDDIWKCFLKKTVNEEEKWYDDIVSTIFVVRIVKALERDIEKLFRTLDIALIDLGTLKKSAHINKGIDTIERISAAAKTISDDVGMGTPETGFTVVPSLLQQKAEEAQMLLDDIGAEIEKAQLTIQKTGNLWNAEDYDEISSDAWVQFDQMLESMESMKGLYGQISVMASAYQSLQNTSVQEFQAAAH